MLVAFHSSMIADSKSALELTAEGIVHDVRGCMSVAKALAQQARRLIETGRLEEASAMLQRIDRAASNGADLCGDVLECSRRNGHAALQLALADVDLVALVREQVALFASCQCGPAVEFLATDGCVPVRTHPRSIERVLSNLLQNAK